MMPPPESSRAGSLDYRTVPIPVLSLLSVGRLLKKKGDAPAEDEFDANGFGGTDLERRFLGSEWSVDLSFGPPLTSIKTVAELPAAANSSLGPERSFAEAPLCGVADHEQRRAVVPVLGDFSRLLRVRAAGRANHV